MEHFKNFIINLYHKALNASHRGIQKLCETCFIALFRGCVLRLIYHQHYVFGDNELRIADSACVNNALFNTMSGSITISENVSFGHNVSVLTGTHPLDLRGKQRQEGWPRSSRNILICRGVWVASNATIVGPCVIGENAAIAAGAVVVNDIPPNVLAGGVPARIIKAI